MENKSSKVIATIIIVVVFIALFAVVSGIGESGAPVGKISLIIFAGFIAGLRAVWKKDKKQDGDN